MKETQPNGAFSQQRTHPRTHKKKKTKQMKGKIQLHYKSTTRERETPFKAKESFVELVALGGTWEKTIPRHITEV